MTLDFQTYMELAHLNAESTLEDVTKVIEKFEEALKQGEGEAGFMLGYFASPDSALSERIKSEIGASREKSVDYFRKGYAVLMREASAGNGRAMHLIAMYYQSGLPPVSCDSEQYEYWINKAREVGYRGAGGQL